jgi:hypothetical protein
MIQSFAAHARQCLVSVILLAAGCAAGDGQADAASHGFMVLGAGAGAFGLTPGDTLVEQPAARVPAVLRQEIEREARRVDYPRGCTRYFASGPATVVFGARCCTRDPGGDLLDRVEARFRRCGVHDWGFVLFRQEGDRLVRDPRPFNAMATVCPANRDRWGRSSSRCP